MRCYETVDRYIGMRDLDRYREFAMKTLEPYDLLALRIYSVPYLAKISRHRVSNEHLYDWLTVRAINYSVIRDGQYRDQYHFDLSDAVNDRELITLAEDIDKNGITADMIQRIDPYRKLATFSGLLKRFPKYVRRLSERERTIIAEWERVSLIARYKS